MWPEPLVKTCVAPVWLNRHGANIMKTMFAAIAAGLLLAGSALAAENDAASPSGAAEESPGHQMQAESGPGASEYSPGHQPEGQGASETPPGHQMQEETGPGASQQAPGH